MFFGTGIPTIIVVLKKQRSTNDVLFIDASKGFIKDGNKNKLRAIGSSAIFTILLHIITLQIDVRKNVRYNKIKGRELIIWQLNKEW